MKQIKELEIARKNINEYLVTSGSNDFLNCKNHKRACKRFLIILEYLKEEIDKLTAKKYYQEFKDNAYNRSLKEIRDLEETIKFYESYNI